MRNHDDATSEFDTDVPGTTSTPTARKHTVPPGRRASILAGMTLGVATVVIVGQEFTTVVSYAHMHA